MSKSLPDGVTVGIAIFAAVIGGMIANYGTSSARICEYRTQLAKEVAQISLDLIRVAQEDLGIPFICYLETGRAGGVKIEGSPLDAGMTTTGAQIAYGNFLRNTQDLNDKTLLYITTIRSWNINSRSLSGATFAEKYFPAFWFNVDKLKILHSLKDFQETQSRFIHKCQEDDEYHTLWKDLSKKRIQFVIDLHLLNKQCFDSTGLFWIILILSGGVIVLRTFAMKAVNVSQDVNKRIGKKRKK